MNHPTRHANPLIALIDGTARLQGRLKGAFADSRLSTGLGETEMTVLNAVAEAPNPPTVPQIGRALGHPRQVIQRAANALIAAGLIATRDNPDHKRASLLIPTPQGIALKNEANRRADAIAVDLLTGVDAQLVNEATRLLETVRLQLEAQLRTKKV
ncbi:MarR family transcriptional regulator [Sphingorhabdus pulchriflava]|uniref:MarR family transcriptional regulator n=1 Tax=Sphingorhabdus pulchriflava TaxID=2292257 RepID=A0A371BJU0_9SPHN|nr:helix-turn-helix domain-containing protein [Sphingorhabdus pulchriflava]RDV07827.1 MarR family transcriptional regulator [Sphingorhabdus pulchriflava]